MRRNTGLFGTKITLLSQSFALDSNSPIASTAFLSPQSKPGLYQPYRPGLAGCDVRQPRVASRHFCDRRSVSASLTLTPCGMRYGSAGPAAFPTQIKLQVQRSSLQPNIAHLSVSTINPAECGEQEVKSNSGGNCCAYRGKLWKRVEKSPAALAVASLSQQPCTSRTATRS